MTKSELQSIVEQKWIMQGSHSVETVFDAIANCLRKGEKVTIKGFGTFSVKTRKEKIAQNITKGESMILPEHKKACWKASSKIIIK